MLNSRVVRTLSNSSSPSAHTVGDTLERLAIQLEEFLVKNGKGRESARSGESSWEDEEYLYLETKLSVSELPFCDISISDGKAFIRIARLIDTDPAPEFTPLAAETIPIELPISSPAG